MKLNDGLRERKGAKENRSSIFYLHIGSKKGKGGGKRGREKRCVTSPARKEKSPVKEEESTFIRVIRQGKEGKKGSNS